MGTRGTSRRAGVALAVLAALGVGGLCRAAGPASGGPDQATRKKALALNQITGSAPLRGRLLELLEDRAGTRKLLAAAQRMARKNLGAFNLNASYVLALAAHELGEVDAATTFYKLHAAQSFKLLSESGLAQAYGGLIQLNYDYKKYAEAEKLCREFLSLEGTDEGAIEELKPRVIRRLVMTIAKQGSTEKALAMLDRLTKADPKNWLMLALRAEVLREADRLEDAVKVYQKVIEMVGKDDRLEKRDREDYAGDYRYLLSGLYIDLGQVDKAAEQLKALLEKDPNNPMYNNDLGYIWADHGKNLAEAEKLIRKAIEEDRKLRRKASPALRPGEERDNPAHLDSLAWVLFKRGKAKEARPYLLEAVKDKEGQHTEVYDHLGDVHMALGEKDEAIKAWTKAVEVAGPSKREQKRKAEVEKKLKEHQGR
jgi:tetratricopeptide (TPR) repeat protein